jgi:hypothetical protein
MDCRLLDTNSSSLPTALAEAASNIVLIRISRFEQRHHGVGFRSGIINRIVRKEHAADQDHSLLTLGLEGNAIVDQDGTGRGSRGGQQRWLLRIRIHGVSMADRPARARTKKPEARPYGKTQKADRFWFAPGAAQKAGQSRLRTRRGRNHAGPFVDRLNTGAANLQRKNAKSGQVVVRTPSGEKGRPVAAPDEARLQPCGAVRRSPQTPELRTFNGKTQKADRF